MSLATNDEQQTTKKRIKLEKNASLKRSIDVATTNWNFLFQTKWVPTATQLAITQSSHHPWISSSNHPWISDDAPSHVNLNVTLIVTLSFLIVLLKMRASISLNSRSHSSLSRTAASKLVSNSTLLYSNWWTSKFSWTIAASWHSYTVSCVGVHPCNYCKWHNRTHHLTLLDQIARLKPFGSSKTSPQNTDAPSRHQWQQSNHIHNHNITVR